MTYGRDTDIGTPTDCLSMDKVALAMQILIDETLDAESLGVADPG
jgi:hypothetical protein